MSSGEAGGNEVASVLEMLAVGGRDVAALQDPRPVNLIGACGPREAGAPEACFATVIWVTPLSHTPPLLAFALRPKSRTMELLRASGAFSASTLRAVPEAIELAEFCGSTTGRITDKGSRVPHKLVEVESAEEAAGEDGSKATVPIPQLASSWTACTVRSVQEAGDHLLVIGEVQQAHVDAPRDERGNLTPTDVLLCIQHGAYGAVGSL